MTDPSAIAASARLTQALSIQSKKLCRGGHGLSRFLRVAARPALAFGRRGRENVPVAPFHPSHQPEGPMAGKFEIKKAKNGQFYFNLKASNGEIILTSEQYKAKASAKNGIDSVKSNSPHDD